MINPEEWKRLTESKFWKPDQDKEYRVTLKNWRATAQQFNKDEEPTLTFQADVVSINGVPLPDEKIFSTTGKKACRLLKAACDRAESESRVFLSLWVLREKNTYQIVDLTVITGAVRNGNA